MATPNYRQLFGALELPTAAGDVTASLAELDTTRATLAALVKQALIDDLAPVWETAVATLPASSHLRRSPTPAVVGQVLEVEPSERHLTQVKVDWPVLAVYRTGEAEVFELTLEIEAQRQRWAIEWILGPLGVDDYRRIGDALTFAAKVIQRALRRGWAAGLDDGALKFHDTNVSWIKVQQVQTGQLETEAGALFYGVRVGLEVVERLRDDTSGDDTLVGTDFTGQLEGGTADGVVDILAQTDPT